MTPGFQKDHLKHSALFWFRNSCSAQLTRGQGMDEIPGSQNGMLNLKSSFAKGNPEQPHTKVISLIV